MSVVACQQRSRRRERKRARTIIFSTVLRVSESRSPSLEFSGSTLVTSMVGSPSPTWRRGGQREQKEGGEERREERGARV